MDSEARLGRLGLQPSESFDFMRLAEARERPRTVLSCVAIDRFVNEIDFIGPALIQ